jgi:hypothetical protein
MPNCPVCAHAADSLVSTDFERAVKVSCPACGSFEISVGLVHSLPPEHLPRLSHKIRRMQGSGAPRSIDPDLAQRLVSDPLPSVREQADNFLSWAGDELRGKNPVAYFQLFPPRGEALLAAVIGAFDSPSAWVIVSNYLPAEGLAEFRNLTGNTPEVRLTPTGWDRYEQLKRSVVESRLAFMAMPFNDTTINRVFEACFRPAVAATGFELRRITDNQRAGLIDDQLRVAIRRARFTIAELTLGNCGVYWEAGFAEGLNRPVIYTCERTYFDRADTKPHFDINHCSTVIWKESELGKAAEELKARIRATLPDEAKMSD